MPSETCAFWPESSWGRMRNFTGNYVSWLIDFWVDWCLANSTNPDQTLQNSSAASDQGLHCFPGFSRYTCKFLKLLCPT